MTFINPTHSFLLFMTDVPELGSVFDATPMLSSLTFPPSVHTYSTCFVSPSYDSLYVSPPHAPSLKVEERTPTWEPTTTVKIRIQYDAIDRYTCKMDNTSSPTTPIPTRAIFHVFVWDVCGGCFTI